MDLIFFKEDKMTIKHEHLLVSKSRPLLDVMNDKYALGELKILEVYLAKINPLDPSSARVTISKDEYCNLMGIDSGKVRTEQLEKYLENFLSKKVTLRFGKNKESFVINVLFTTAKYDSEKKEITLKCNTDEDVYKAFFNLEAVGYASYLLKNTIKLKSIYSYKLYMLVKSKLPVYTFTVPLDELKETLGISGEYFQAFKRVNNEILKPTIEEINEWTDTFIECEQIKNGRKVTAIKFKICENNKNTVKKSEKLMSHYEDDEELTDEQKKAFDAMEEYLELSLKEDDIEDTPVERIKGMLAQIVPDCTPEQIEDLIEVAYSKVSENGSNYLPKENRVCDYIIAQTRYTKAQKPKNFYRYLREAVKDNYSGWVNQ